MRRAVPPVGGVARVVLVVLVLSIVPFARIVSALPSLRVIRAAPDNPTVRSNQGRAPMMVVRVAPDARRDRSKPWAAILPSAPDAPTLAVEPAQSNCQRASPRWGGSPRPGVTRHSSGELKPRRYHKHTTMLPHCQAKSFHLTMGQHCGMI
jgi:hypothetical protein